MFIVFIEALGDHFILNRGFPVTEPFSTTRLVTDWQMVAWQDNVISIIIYLLLLNQVTTRP